MLTVIKNRPTEQGISSTLYDPRKTQALSEERLTRQRYVL